MVASKVRKTKKKRVLRKKPFGKKGYSNLMELFLSFLNIVKIFQWKTKHYSEHISADQYYESMEKTVDTFIEVYLSKSQQVQNTIFEQMRTYPFAEKNITTNQQMQSKLYVFRTFLNEMNLYLDEVADADLLNLRDELLVHLQQFLYRLHLK